MVFILFAPVWPLVLVINLIQGYHDIWTTIMSVAFAFALYNICSPYKRFVDKTTNVSGKIMDWNC